MQKHYDIIIIGAGLVGSSLACALQQCGFKIALLEKQLPDFTVNHTTQDRPISLAYGSQQILQTLGLWKSLADLACPIQQVQVSEQQRFGGMTFRASDYHLPALGYVVPYPKLYQSLYEAAAQQTMVDVVCIEALLAIDHASSSTVSVTIAGQQQQLSADLVVAADGAESTCRGLMQIDVTRRDEKQTAMIAELVLEKPHEHVAYERFSELGTLAILPLPNGKARLVWTYAEKDKAAIDAMSEQALLKTVNDSFHYYLGDITALNVIARFPLQTIIAKQQIKPGFVLLGNAAHFIYPIAAQGFNLGLRDAAVLAEVLCGSDAIGELDVLQRYLDWRLPDQKRITRLTQGTSDLFELQLPFMAALRGMGLLFADLIPPIKKRIAKRAMGLAGKMPKLMRGIELLP